MTVINGLPAHVLLVHFIVVLAPLTAILEILCGLWRPARTRLVWLVLALAVVTMVLTPLTVNAGEWLYDRDSEHSPVLQIHAGRGEWMPYIAAALLIVAIVLAVVHWLEGRSPDKRRSILNTAVAIIAVAVGVSSIILVVRIGDAGAQSVWQNELAKKP